MKQENFTKNQHYIPQVYLRGFSPEYKPLRKSKLKSSAYTIYAYAIRSEKQLKKAVPIDDICQKKYFYEMKDDDGKFLNPNWIEKGFKCLEDMFSDYRYKLEKKAFNEENYSIKHFLDKEEIVFWLSYISLQVIRLPELLETAQQEVKRLCGDNVSDNDARNFVRRYCIPLFGKVDEKSKETMVFNSIIGPMFPMKIILGVDIEGKLLTSDKTVYIYTDEIPCESYEEVIFPISAQICLVLIGGKKQEGVDHNRLFLIDADLRDYINGCISSAAFNKVYSNHLFSKREMKMIEESRII
ncbi:DUF4238 domain-containing protein [Butyrivibrio sp. LB2008]|uniref:DUF4238 domain-containing protein n=1 Tax=Butyrivibrio sp. LB2008 TaxID=1408305 RepID=UPI000479B27B|nr:DUF4238 domain-containing protein [Butyrivibrio sp. LB2008]